MVTGCGKGRVGESSVVASQLSILQLGRGHRPFGSS
jgi:hypothetical protein